jgi:hemerythrin-like domain-containing protein
MTRKSSLERTFVEDHKHLTRGFSEILKALDADDWERASHLADELDRLVGSHIEFEERFLYPEVGKVLRRTPLR